MSYTIPEHDQGFERLSCGKCGIVFFVHTAWSNARRSDNATWYCPNGHSRWFPPGTSREDKLQQQVEILERSKARAERSARTAEFRRRAAVGQQTKLKKRVAAGVCPCCSRSFKNLREHMSHVHPDYAGGGDE